MNYNLSEKWCQGKKFKESRHLTPKELEEINGRINYLRWMTWGIIFGYPIGFVVIGLLCNSNLNRIGFFDILFNIMIIVYLMLGLALSIMIVKEKFELIKQLKRDHNDGVVYVFEDNLEVLPISTLIFRLKGTATNKIRQTDIIELAKTEDDSKNVPVSGSLLGPEPGNLYDYSQRHLTDEERSEIGKKIESLKHLTWRDWLFYGFAMFWALCLIAGIIREGIILFLKSYIFGAIAAFVFVYSAVYNYWSRLRLARQLKKCLEAGIMVLAAKKDNLGNETKKMCASMEYMPAGNVVWTMERNPALWRINIK